MALSIPTLSSARRRKRQGLRQQRDASDIELAGDYAYVGSYAQGMVIVNISSCDDPSQPAKCQPFVQGAYKCSGGQFDVQLSPDAKIAVVAHESASANKECHQARRASRSSTSRTSAAPREVAFISDKNPDDSRQRETAPTT